MSITIREMTEEEARTCCTKINRHHEDARKLAMEFVEREGWRALKYSSLKAAIDKEFPWSSSTFYRVVEEATIRRQIEVDPRVEVPAATLGVLKELPPEDRKAAWDTARKMAGHDAPGKNLVQQVVAQRKPAPEPEPPAFADGTPDAEVQRADIQREPGDDEEEDLEPDEPDTVDVQADDRVWLSALPAWSKLLPALRTRFAADALAWKRTRGEREAFHKAVQPALRDANRAARDAPWVKRLTYFFRWRGPHEWQACADCKDGQGMSTGRRTLLVATDELACGTCNGCGYVCK